MKNIIPFFFAFLCLATGIGGAIYLVMNGHPWFALLIILLTASIRIRWD